VHVLPRSRRSRSIALGLVVALSFGELDDGELVVLTAAGLQRVGPA
jgi:hypothetical protein